MSFILVVDKVSGTALQMSVVGIDKSTGESQSRTGTAVCDSEADVWKLLEAMYGPDDSFWRNRFTPMEVDPESVEGFWIHWPVPE